MKYWAYIILNIELKYLIGVIRVNRKAVYSIIVPVYNEELVINECYRRLKEVMEISREEYEIIFVNDGSIDNTRIIAENICRKDEKIKLVNLSRNFGHQAAITAGMDMSKGKAMVVIDADLQDPPEVILGMIAKWKEGYEVVYGKRIKREGENLFKKASAKVYYRVLKLMTNVDIPVDVGDFRLIDRKVYNVLTSLPEKNRYVRGLISWIGYNQTCVEFVRQERFAGESKYSLRKMIKFACDGITAFSYKPLAVASYLGGIISFIGIVLVVGIIISSIINKMGILSLGFILAINLLMFGLIFICLGIMGQYIGRIFDESKDRPIYIIDNITEYERVDKKYEISS